MKARMLSLCFVALGVLTEPAWAGWRFAVMGDTRGNSNVTKVGSDWVANIPGGVNSTVLSELAGALVNEDIDFVLVLGDLVQRYDINKPPVGYTPERLVGEELDLWLSVMQPVYDAGIGVYPIRGNHEASALPAPWTSRFDTLPQNGPAGEVGLTYSFKYKEALFVGLDDYAMSGNANVAQVNQTWLDQQFDRTNKLHTIVFGHAPAFPSTDPVLPSIQNALPSRNKRLDPAAQALRDTFWNSLGDEGAQMYLTAHEHLFARGLAEDANGNEIRQIVVGAGGAPLDPTPQLLYAEPGRVLPEASDFTPNQFGYLVCEVDGVHLTAQYKAKLFSPDLPGAQFEVVDGWTLRAAPPSWAKSVGVVPEPGTLAMLALLAAGLAAAAGWRRIRE